MTDASVRGPSGARRQGNLFRLDALAEFVIYVAVALVAIWPVSAHLTTRLIGSGDTETYLWMNWRVGELIRGFTLLPTELPDGVHPYGSSLLTSDGYLPIYLGGLWNLVFRPVLAFNAATLTASMLNLWGGRELARRFTSSRAIWIVGAIAFATAPAIGLRYYGHYTFTFAFTSPLIVAAAVDTARDRKPVRPVRLALLLFLSYLCSVFYLIFGALAYVTIVLVTRFREWRRLVPAIAAAVAATVALMSPFLISRFHLEGDERSAGAPSVLAEESVPFSADVTSVAVQPRPATLLVPGFDDLRLQLGENVVEATVFPGFLLLLGLGTLLLVRTTLRAGLLVSAAALWIMGLGPSLRAYGQVMVIQSDGRAVRWLPFTALQSLPGLGMIRTPNRTSFTLAAVLVVGLVIGLEWLRRTIATNAGRAVCFAGCIGLLATNLVFPINWATMQVDSTIEAGLHEIRRRADNDESMIFVPADCYDELNNDSKLNIFADLPMVGCHANFASIPWYSGISKYVESEPLAGLRCWPTILGRRSLPFAADELIDRTGIEEMHRTLGVRFYIIDRSLLPDDRCTRRGEAIADLVRANAEVVAANDRWEILDAFPPSS